MEIRGKEKVHRMGMNERPRVRSSPSGLAQNALKGYKGSAVDLLLYLSL